MLDRPFAGPFDVHWTRTVETLPVIVWIAGPRGTIDFVNHRWHEAFGAGTEAIEGRGWDRLVHPLDADRMNTGWIKAFESGTPLRLDVRLRHADGTYRWMRSEADPLRDEAGKIVRWFGVLLDINNVRQSERGFHALGEALPLIVWTADATGAVDWYNARWYEYTGQNPSEARGWGWQAAHHPDDFLEVMKRWPHSIETGEPFDMEFRLRRHDGTFNWFLTRAEPMRDENGRVVRWYGSCMDIQAQREALQRSRRIAETLQDVFIPKEFPAREKLRIDATYLPAEKDALIGGDWFDAFELPDGRIVFSIGDVAGHGLQASITVGRLRQAILTLAFRIDDPVEILAEVDRILGFQEPGTMVTAIVGSTDAALTRIRYCAAGHPAPLLGRRGAAQAKFLPTGGLPLGIGFNDERTVHEIEIAEDDVFALYTDGITEFARDVTSAEERLRTAIAILVGNTKIVRPAAAVQEIVFNGHVPQDDAALLIMQFSRVEAPAQRDDPRALERTWRFHSSDAYTAHTSRVEIGEHLRALAADDADIFNAELIVGEILANTVEHAPGLVEVEIDWSGEHPAIAVRDIGPGLRSLQPQLPEDVFDENGRGLFLIHRLASRVSVRPLPGYGTEIRVTLPLAKRQTSADSVREPQ
ncbi:MAG: PAS domain-containing protein [Candidatus Eremiobacteraeota bacterium]|nr:PAS domain-containing protein [Candidatus Eremiobacteraeota bacterium]